MSGGRESNGRFGMGNRANPEGRPRHSRSVNATILKELNASVIITENQKRRKISKLAANAKQIVNKGASGELRAAKMALDLALKAELDEAIAPSKPVLTENDEEIVARFIARLRLTHAEETVHGNAD